jgi:hypothetical protein
MTQNFQCGDQAALVGYLYDDCEPLERDAIAAHVISCAACAEELAMLSATRRQLASWTPPEARLGFRITAADADSNVVAMRPAGDGGTRGAWWRQPLPAWAQLAAAVVIFAAGVSLGAARGPLQAVPVVDLGQRSTVEAELATVKQRLRTLESAPATVLASLPDDHPLIARVRQEIRHEVADSGQRLEMGYRRALAYQAVQLANDQAVRQQISNDNVENVRGEVDSLAQWVMASYSR